MTYNQKALKKYQSVGLDTAVGSASPHELITMLFDGALTAITRAKGLIEQKQMEAKGQQISKASRILVHLKGSLDLEQGGDVAATLDPLYDYMIQRLVVANRELDVAMLDEVSALLKNVKSGWEEMPEKTR